MNYTELLSLLVLVASLLPISALIMTGSGKVALVTGATRGIGKGIALELAEEGYKVYCTGRSMGGVSTQGLTLEGTIKEIQEAGGQAVGIACDHAVDSQVKAVVERVEKEEGRLDLLVNNAFQLTTPDGAAGLLNQKFYEQGAAGWDEVHTVGLRSHYMASCYAVPLMIKTASTSGSTPLIAHISSFGGLTYTFNVAYVSALCAVDRLANDMAIELEEDNVACVSVWPGVVMTERNKALVDSGEWERDVGLPVDQAESPRFTGRAVAALASDISILSKSGSVQVVAECAKEYGFVDMNGSAPPSIRSLKFMIPAYVLPKIFVNDPERVSKISSYVPDLLLPMGFLRNSKPPPQE
ncbi:unnamed protein product [Chrysoparadoxa australica]